MRKTEAVRKLVAFLLEHAEHGGTFAPDVAPPVVRLDCDVCHENVQIHITDLRHAANLSEGEGDADR